MHEVVQQYVVICRYNSSNISNVGNIGNSSSIGNLGITGNAGNAGNYVLDQATRLLHCFEHPRTNWLKHNHINN